MHVIAVSCLLGHRKKAVRQATEFEMHCVAPVGKKEGAVDRWLAVVERFIDL